MFDRDFAIFVGRLAQQFFPIVEDLIVAVVALDHALTV
jgi:hypothetical protein